MSYDTQTYKRRGKGEGKGEGEGSCGAPCRFLCSNPWRATNLLGACSLPGTVQMSVKFVMIMNIQYKFYKSKLHASQNGSTTIPESGVSNPARSLPEMTMYLPFPHFALRSANA